ncbi:MAG TPA: methyltransferase domain-containing protein [Gammaproteobacteria bacterium]|nr:methyltransferase domain-containing protein [Gammaproteobacteria bacterium]
MNQSAEQTNEFVQFWNTTLADKFERFRNILMNGLSYHSRVPLEKLTLAPGSQVVDMGCGWGDTSIALARKLDNTGKVLGVDCVDRFLQKGREDAREAGLANVQFVAADVQTYPFKAEYDLCFSRFGMMFFENPVAAMRNIRTALKPGGKLLFIVWRTIEYNDWLGKPKELVLQFLPAPGDDAQTCGPGPFSMANPDVVTAQLKAAGFDNIEFEAIDGPVTVGDSVEEAIAFQLAIGPAGEVFREAGEAAEKQRETIEQAMRDMLSSYEQDGKIVMPSSSWAITAKNPD